MRRRYLSQEEIMARKLLGFLGGAFVILFFAGILFFISSTPPEIVAVSTQNKSNETAIDEAFIEAFKDRIAQVQLGQWKLPERKAEAKRLLKAAPTARLRRDVEKLIKDLRQEERFERLADFEALRRSAAILAAKKRFSEAETALARFGKEHDQFADDVGQELRQLAKRRDRAYRMNERLAEERIARGDVAAVEKLSAETLAFATSAERLRVALWIDRAEERRESLKQPVVARRPDTEPPVPPAQGPEQEPAVAVAPSGTAVKPIPGDTTPEPAQPLTDTAGGFAGVVTAVAGDPIRVTITEGAAPVALSLEGARVLVDEFVPSEAFHDTVRRGAGIWLLGRKQKQLRILKRLGKTIVRAIDEVTLAFMAGNFLPDPVWEDKTVPGRKWLFGKVELGFPVVRVAVDDETFLVMNENIVLIRRTKAEGPPAVQKGSRLWVEGTRTPGGITAERVVLLAEKLARDPHYLQWCR